MASAGYDMSGFGVLCLFTGSHCSQRQYDELPTRKLSYRIEVSPQITTRIYLTIILSLPPNGMSEIHYAFIPGLKIEDDSKSRKAQDRRFEYTNRDRDPDATWSGRSGFTRSRADVFIFIRQEAVLRTGDFFFFLGSLEISKPEII